MEIRVKERSEDPSNFFAGGALAHANQALERFFPGERFRIFSETLGLPEKYTRLADRYFDVSLPPNDGIGRRPQLPPPLKCNMHPKIGESFIDGVLSTHDIIKDGKLTWCLPSDLWEKSCALSRKHGLQQYGFLAREAIEAWMSCGPGPVDPDTEDSYHDFVLLLR